MCSRNEGPGGRNEKKKLRTAAPSVHPRLDQLFSELRNDFPEVASSGYFDGPLPISWIILDLFQEGGAEKTEGKPGAGTRPSLQVGNVLVDNAAGGGAPSSSSPNPTYATCSTWTALRGPARHRSPSFMHIRAGSLLEGHGGYLVVISPICWR